MTDPARLPAIITSYLTAHRNHDVNTAITAFAADATVTDEGNTRRGPDEILDWLTNAAGEYTYTIELTGTRQIDDERWVATHHLEGDFPGGVVDLNHDFTLRDGKIQHLTIAP
ncbi:MAG TPA: nuclear transport factor 2 family protein [Sporichthyaceae bacterium]|jgi:hypothetical protein|nr:nuclear transport factor 2 family protein [Sporichthyaceae bacterium]